MSGPSQSLFLLWFSVFAYIEVTQNFITCHTNPSVKKNMLISIQTLISMLLASLGDDTTLDISKPAKLYVLITLENQDSIDSLCRDGADHTPS